MRACQLVLLPAVLAKKMQAPFSLRSSFAEPVRLFALWLSH